MLCTVALVAVSGAVATEESERLPPGFRYPDGAAEPRLQNWDGAAEPRLQSSDDLRPPLVALSNLTVQARFIGQFPFEPVQTLAGFGADLQSPVAVGDRLFVADGFGKIYAAKYRDGQIGPVATVFDGRTDAPDGLLLTFSMSAILNIAAGPKGKSLYVLFRSVNTPLVDIPLRPLPDPEGGNISVVGEEFFIPDIYRFGSTTWGVLYEYRIKGDRLCSPRAIAAFQNAGGFFTQLGGGMLTLPDGRIALATGDSLPTGFDGRIAPQDGRSELAAGGLRNVQHLDLGESEGEPALGFVDLGQITAEEVNWVRLSEVLDTAVGENFGWGRNPFDGLAREGTFYVSGGLGFSSPGAVAVGRAPTPEPFFVQPHAQYGRQDPNGGIAGSGPVTSAVSFRDIRCLFGDLARGILYATTESLFATNVQVKRVRLLDEQCNEVAALPDLVGQTRADPRFFKLPDGGAAVLLEGLAPTGGSMFELTEVEPPY